MIRSTRPRSRKWLDALLHVDDTPRRTAAAYAVGVFFGFSPFLGLHTILALASAFVFRLNRVAVLLGVYSNLPWIIAPYYAFATMAGAMALGAAAPPDLAEQLAAVFDGWPVAGDFWKAATLLRPLFWPYVVGSMFGAMLLAVIAYWVTIPLLLARRHSALEENTEQP